MVGSFLDGAGQWARELIYALTSPLDYAIDEFFPSVSQLLDLFNSFVDWVIDFFPWILSWFHIPKAIVVISCLLIIGYTMVVISSNFIKMLLRWWDLAFI